MSAGSKAKRQPSAGAGVLDQKFRDVRISRLYFTVSGDAIAPLGVIVAAEINRRLDTAARAAKAGRHG